MLFQTHPPDQPARPPNHAHPYDTQPLRYIGSFRVSIPWARLTYESVSVEIENVVLIAKPGDPNKWDPEELRRCNLTAKRVLLEKATAAARAWSSHSRRKTQDEKAESAGYFGKLATRIADNLFVFLKNVHVRFEDPVSDPAGSLSAGIIIQDFQIQSTNDQWEAAFVSRDEEKKRASSKDQAPAIYKKISMRGFAVYWNCRSISELGALPLEDLLREMTKYEEITEARAAQGGGAEPLTYIIKPVTLTVKLTHNEGGDPRLPVFAADVELPSLNLGVQTEQYVQAMGIKNTFDRVQRMGLLLPYRPHKSVKEDPKAWWRYAYFCVKKATTSLGMVEVIEMFRKRRRYIQLFEKVLKAQAAAAAADAALAVAKKKKDPLGAEKATALLADAPPLTAEEQTEFDLFEETVPLDSLVVWRTLVHAAMRKQAKQQQLLRKRASQSVVEDDDKSVGSTDTFATSKSEVSERGPSPAPRVGGWISSWWAGGGKQAAGAKKGADVDSDDSDAEFDEAHQEEDWQDMVGLEKGEEEEVLDGDISLDELIAQAGKTLPMPGPPKADTELFRVHLRTTGVLSLYAKHRAPLLELTSSLDVEVKQKGDTFSAAMRLPHFELKDLYTPHALFSHIAKAGDEGRVVAADNQNIFDLAFVTSPQSTSVKIRTRPLDLVYNKGWLAQVLKLQPPPDVAEALAQRAVENMTLATAAVASDMLGKVSLVADIEIAAPRIFIPLAEAEDKGFLLLDTGHLSFKGGTLPGDPTSSSWDLKLSQIQSKLLRRKGEWKRGTLAEGEGQLIEPFEIHVGMGMRGEKAGGEGADTSVTTSLRPCIRGIFTPARLKTMLAIVTNLGLPEDEEEAAAAVALAQAGPALGQSAMAMHRQVADESGGTLGRTSSASSARPPTAPSPARRSVASASVDTAMRTTVDAAAAVVELDPLHKKMEVQVNIPSVVLELRDDTASTEASSRLFIVAMEGFKMDYLARSFDTSLQVDLGALSIENLAKAAGTGERRFLAHSSSSSSSSSKGEEETKGKVEALVHFHMASFLDREKAPAYPGHDTVILLEFATLDLKCDPESIRLLAPFYGALMRFEEEVPVAGPAFLQQSGPSLKRTLSIASNASTQASRAMASGAAALAAAKAAAELQKGKTMAVTARLARMSVELLTGARRPIIMAEIAGLASEVEMGEAMAVSVVLQTFEVTDTQPESRDNAIRKLICPKHGVAEAEAEGGGDALALATSSSTLRKPLLTADVKEDKAGNAYDIDVTLEDFTLNILVEALMASIDVTLESVNGLMDVLAAGQSPAAPAAPAAAQQQQQQQQGFVGAPISLPPLMRLPPSTSPARQARGSAATMHAIGEGDEEEEEGGGHPYHPGHTDDEPDDTRLSATALQAQVQGAEAAAPSAMGMRIKVKLLNPGLILIENARNYDSRAVSLRGTFQVLYVVAHEGTAGTETIHVDAQGLEAFVDVVGGSSEAGPVQIITPFALGVHMKRQSEQDKLLISELVLNLDKILMRVAYHDVRLVQGVLGGLGEASTRYAQATTQAAAAAAASAAAAAAHQQQCVGGGQTSASGGLVGPVWDQEGGGEEYIPAADQGPEGQLCRHAGSLNLDVLEEEEEADSVTLGLTAADEELMATKNTALTKTNLDVAGLEVLFINDYDGRDQPLLELNVEGLHVELEQCADAYKGGGHLVLRVRFFNPAVLFWEPVIEPWDLRGDISTESSGVVVSLGTDRILFVDLTEGFLKTLSRTYSIFLSAASSDSSSSSTTTTASSSSLPGVPTLTAAGTKSSSTLVSSSSSLLPSTNIIGAAQYVLTNKTGLELEVDVPGGSLLVAPNATVALDMKESRGGGGGGRASSRNSDSGGFSGGREGRIGAQGSSPMVSLAFTGEVGKHRQPLSHLKTDVPGTFIYPLKPVQELGKTYPQPVVEETWENERSDRVTSNWRSPFLPTDRERWSDEQGKRERKREDITLPGPEWRWQDEWHVDMGYGLVGKEIDGEGWTYGVEFPGFTLNRIKRTHREMDGVRRRRWIRTRVPLPPAMDDPTRPLAVAWTVNLGSDGRTELSVETTVRLVNESDVGLDIVVVVDGSANLPPYPMESIPPHGSVCVPLLLAYASTVRIRPSLLPLGTSPSPPVLQQEAGRGGGGGGGDSSPYTWSEPFLIDRGAGASEEVVVCPPSPTATHPTPVCLVVDAEVTSGGLKSIYLRPPFLMENYLPCHVWISISPHTEANVRVVAPGTTAGILSKPPQVSQVCI